jgi:alpha-L-fucosidase
MATPVGTRIGPDIGRVDWSSLARPLPHWFTDAKLGIFVHWGAYSVPAWAEPVGELGAVDEATWFQHNAYAEWYWNTIRFADSPAREHHRRSYGDAPYDEFLDAWRAEEFDPQDWCALFARAGARYVVPTTKHHDGIALWDAPGTGARNTVRRGPRRDLIGDLESAVREAGLRFGVYYSGGLDWNVSDFPVIDTFANVRALRPTDAAYAAYAYVHVRDLIDRYRPDVLWNDIEWPDAGKHAGSLGLLELFRHYYATVPGGVVNDRWGDTHWDYRTSEYQHGLDAENNTAAWQNCRGIGLSFGYNQVEDARHLMSGPQLVRHLVDIVSRGGNLLLNVGPTADGAIPEGQRRTLEGLAAWMAGHSHVVHGSRPVDRALAEPGETPWVRWTGAGRRVWAVVDAPAGGAVTLPARPEHLDPASAVLATGSPVPARADAGGITVELPAEPAGTPVAIGFSVS